MCYDTCLFFFFFFKQKTAYEMRISDWSSDVCSSDLAPESTDVRAAPAQVNCDAVYLHHELDAAPPPVGEGCEQLGHVIHPCVGTAGQVRAPDGGIHERADRVEIVAVARIQILGVPLAHLPRLHPTILGDRKSTRLNSSP